jgi:glucose/arabinose dehydrogenase
MVAVTAASATAGEVAFTTLRIASDLAGPLFVTHAPGDMDRIFIIEQVGRIRIYKDNALLEEPFLDVNPESSCCDERGLLGLAFHPGYAKNGTFFINYTNLGGDTVVARYQVSDDPDIADPAGDIILTNGQPFANHNAGWLGFGADGYLYVPMGDGGWMDDPGNRAQDITNQLLGKILRINVDGDDFPADPNRDYAIPADNPLVGITGDDEIWAYGLRNPWRMSFDSQTDDLYIADVGQDAIEEINVAPAGNSGGQNYGWRCMEGLSCTGLSGCGCGSGTLTNPLHTYGHGGIHCSVTGGYVYRGSDIPQFQGQYFFADFCSARIWSTQYTGTALTPPVERTDEFSPGGPFDIDFISSFGVDAHGELYLCDLTGDVYKVIPVEPLQVVASSPADNIVDARQPSTLDGSDAQGWSTFVTTFDGNATHVTPQHFNVEEQGGDGIPPAVVSVTYLDTHRLRIRLGDPIEPGAWTTITLAESGASVRVGFLPGDVNGDHTTAPSDILALIDALNGVIELPLSSTDIDRNGDAGPLDILRLIDILNGADAFAPWNGVSLP